MDHATHNRRMRESTMTPAEALEAAKQQWRMTRRWPLRRFRVEGPQGNSRLLARPTADRTKGKYGGQVIELIPVKGKVVPALLAEGLGECPRCKVAAGEPCKGPNGLRKPHAKRKTV